MSYDRTELVFTCTEAFNQSRIWGHLAPFTVLTVYQDGDPPSVRRCSCHYCVALIKQRDDNTLDFTGSEEEEKARSWW